MDRIRGLKNQVLKFGIVGFISFIIDYIILFLLTEFFGIYYIISNAVAYCVSTIINYKFSMRWVFKAKQNLSKNDQFLIFIILSLIGLIINQVIMYLSVERISLHYLISKIIATIIVLIWNFITKKLSLEEKY